MPRCTVLWASFLAGLSLAVPAMAESPPASPPLSPSPSALSSAASGSRQTPFDRASASTDSTPQQVIDRQIALGRWLVQLGDRDPSVRSLARQNLMSLTAAELPALREAVASLPRLTPAQVDPLKSIVTYAIARQALLQQNTVNVPFMGISWPVGSEEYDPAIGEGVMVPNRLFGYVAYRYLEDGDIIVAAGGEGAVKPTPTRRDFLEVIHALSPGQLITVQFLRAGVMREARFPLDACPDTANETGPGQHKLEMTMNRTMSDAQTYWRQQFRPLVDPLGGDDIDAPNDQAALSAGE